MGKLFVVATPIGNLSDITFRAVEVLKSVKYIAAEDTRRTSILLNRYAINSAILVSYHKFSEQAKAQEFIDKIKNENCDIALVSDAGTPCISDPGSILVNCAHNNNIEVIGIPGASAITDALSICGFDISNFAFLGFFPRIKNLKEELIKLIKNSPIKTFVIYESPFRIINTVKYLSSNLDEIELAYGNDLTKKFEFFFRGNADEVLAKLENNDNATKGEYVLIVNKKVNTKHNESVNLSTEAQLIELMVKENISIKQAINILTETSGISKKQAYNASLNLKELLSTKSSK